MNNKIELIIIKFIVKRPLKPSIKFAPFVMNKKHKITNKPEKKSYFLTSNLKI